MSYRNLAFEYEYLDEGFKLNVNSMSENLVALLVYVLQYAINAYMQMLGYVKTFVDNHITKHFHFTFEVGYFV